MTYPPASRSLVANQLFEFSPLIHCIQEAHLRERPCVVELKHYVINQDAAFLFFDDVPFCEFASHDLFDLRAFCALIKRQKKRPEQVVALLLCPLLLASMIK